MNFLPIVQRELQVAARRVATYRLRVLVAAGAGAAAILPMLFSPVSPSMAGSFLFGVLAWGAFAFCQFEGLRVASDALAEEKREGTLGLLFLTDLRGYDVVLGKFASAAVRSFTALFASLPIFALPLLMGGVTAGEFWRVMLALVASLLVALTAGLCVSATTRSGLTAMGATALLLGALVFVLWTAAHQLGAAAAILGGPMSVLLLAFENRFGFQPADFWWALTGCGLLAASFLVAASVMLTRRWHDTGPANPESWLSRLLRPQMGASAVWGGQSSTENPAVWLAERTLPGRRALWLTIGLGSVICLFAGWFGGSAGTGVIIGVMIASGFLIKLWMALVAPQSLNESRRSGALEILLTTPLSPPALIRGQVDALISYFFAPALASLAAYGFMGVVGGMLGGNQDALDGIAPMIGFWVVWFVFFLIDMFALAYAGLWFGLTELRPGIAAAKTVVYVLVIPWVTMIVPLIGCIGMIGWPIFWMVWSSRRLNGRFRDEVGRQFAAESPRSGW